MTPRGSLLARGLVCLVLAGCGADESGQIETFELQAADFTISLLAAGELRAIESTPIMPPAGSRAPRTLEWLAEDNSWVRQGDIIARFDVAKAEHQAETLGLVIDKVDLRVLTKQRELERRLSELGNDLDLVDIEKVMADRFNIDNELAYSRHEIIDAMRDQELLDYRSTHLQEKKDNYNSLQGAEVAVLNAQRATQESQFEEQKGLLDSNVVLAPHDGFFVLEKNWIGQRVEVGSTVFSGNKFAAIPNLQKMEAVLKVRESEAVGLAPGQSARVVIDAFPERPLTGTVTSISAAAAPIRPNNPVKYFTVVVALEQADPEWINPGAIVEAEIFIRQLPAALAVPNQSVFKEHDQAWVLVRRGDVLERRAVQLGVRGAYRSQVLNGLEAGDEIALFLPETKTP